MDAMHSCSCCLRCAPDKSLTTPYIHLGKTEIYSDMLEECFDIHLEVGGDGECGICAACVGRLRDASDFKLQVLRSQAELQARLQFIEAKPAVESEMEGGDRHSEQFLSDEVPAVKPEVVDKEVDVERLYVVLEPEVLTRGGRSGDVESMSHAEPWVKSEMAEEDEMDDEILHEERAVKPEVSDDASSDDDCISPVRPGSAAKEAALASIRQLGMTLSVKLERLRGDEAPHASHSSLATPHCESRQASRMKETHDNIAGLRAEKAYTCDTCGKHFTGKSCFIEHVRGHNAQAHAHTATCTCPICATDLSARHTRAHESEKTYYCDICSGQFTTKSILVRHIRAHLSRSYFCAVCKKVIKRSHFKRHERIHTGEKPHICGDCNKRFARKSDLVRHKRVHTGDKPYFCVDCKKRFLNLGDLLKHKRIHTGEKPYGCVICDKRFTEKGNLDRHKIIHTGEFSCVECNKGFRQKSDLVRHKRIHTGEKPHACEVCNKRFTIKCNLVDHKRIHTSEKLYGCDVCNKGFTDKSNFVAHIKIHTTKEPYVCGVCNKRFISKRDLVRHKKIHTEVK